MKLTIIHEGSCSGRLLLIAAGWSTDSTFYTGVQMPGWDTAVVTLSGGDAGASAIVDALSGYTTIYLYAWSLGVAMSEVLFDAGLRPTAAFAVAGTASPVSDKEGIPVSVYNSTCDQLSESRLFKFRCRMCGGALSFRNVAKKFESGVRDDVSLLRRELEIAAHRPVKESLPWTLAFVCSRDAIFPSEAQQMHWTRRKVPVKILDAPHYVSMQEIVDATVVNLPRAGRRFRRSATTYGRHAIAQRSIAQRLADFAAEAATGKSVDTLLEVGCGTGELSRALGDRFSIREATFIDLYECEPFGIAGRERYLVGDAELLVETLPEGAFDMICSASAIQWFSDTRRFFANCRRLLAPGGLLAISTFADGNLFELDVLRDSTLGYLDIERLEAIVTQFFGNVHISCGTERLSFPSAGELMRHLKLTGVTASTSKTLSPMQLRKLMERLPVDSEGNYTLTFRPVYIIARG